LLFIFLNIIEYSDERSRSSSSFLVSDAYYIEGPVARTRLWVEQQWAGTIKIVDSSPNGTLVDALVITFAATGDISILVQEMKVINQNSLNPAAKILTISIASVT